MPVDTAVSPFEGRQVIVTGASSGIGRAVAVELGKQGAQVILLGRSPADLQATCAQMQGQALKVIGWDFLKDHDLVALVRNLARESGRLYGLCHCAGVVETRPLSSFEPPPFRTMFDVNV